MSADENENGLVRRRFSREEFPDLVDAAKFLEVFGSEKLVIRWKDDNPDERIYVVTAVFKDGREITESDSNAVTAIQRIGDRCEI